MLGRVFENLIPDKSMTIPRVVIANTIKGCGIQVMENNHAWHHKFPTTEELEIFFEELK